MISSPQTSPGNIWIPVALEHNTIQQGRETYSGIHSQQNTSVCIKQTKYGQLSNSCFWQTLPRWEKIQRKKNSFSKKVGDQLKMFL